MLITPEALKAVTHQNFHSVGNADLKNVQALRVSLKTI